MMISAPQTASEWFARRNSGRLSSPEDEATFQNWLESDPANASGYAACVRAWDGLAAYDQTPEIRSRLAVIDPARDPSRRAWLAGAGSTVAACGVGLVGYALLQPQPALAAYSTKAGQRLTAVLPDGSSMTLAPLSRASSRFIDDRGSLGLEAGQVFVRAADAALEIRAGRLAAAARNCAFQISLLDADPEFVVTEGVLKVDGRDLVAGQRLWRETVSPVDVASATEWRVGRLTFRDQRLEEVVAAFNRYSADQFMIANRAAGDLTISGSFRYDGVSDFPQALEDVLNLKVEPMGARRWRIS